MVTTRRHAARSAERGPVRPTTDDERPRSEYGSSQKRKRADGDVGREEVNGKAASTERRTSGSSEGQPEDKSVEAKSSTSRHTAPSKLAQKGVRSSEASPSNTPANPSVAAADSLPSDALDKLHALISPLIDQRTICPSELARALYTQEVEWRAAMPAVRDLVWGCVRRGWVEFTQKGQVRPYEARDSVKGPLRVRKGPKFDEWELAGEDG